MEFRTFFTYVKSLFAYVAKPPERGGAEQTGMPVSR